MSITTLQFLEIVNQLKSSFDAHGITEKIKPRVVKTQADADSLTKADPAGNVWKIGDEWYLLRTRYGDSPVRAAGIQHIWEETKR